MAEAQESRLSIVIDTKNAEERIKELRKQLRELGGQADDTSDDLGDLGDNANGAGNGAGNLTSNSDKAKKSLDSLGKAAAIAGAALVGAIGLSVKKAMEFETAMAEVNKTVDFSTNTGLAQLKGELIELSRVIPLPFEELASIAAAGGQVGVADTKLRGFTETIAKMAIAFDITASETATSMAKIASNYRVPIEDVGNLGDAINALSNSTAANAGEIIDFMLRVGGAAKQLNITGEAAAAMGAQLVDSGKTVEVAGTAVSKVLQTIGNQDGWVKGQIEAFDSLGLATAEFSQLAAKDGVAALALIQERVSELASDKQMGMLDAMFGIAGVHASELFLNAESLAEKLTLVGEGAEKTTTHLGSMEEEFRKMSDTSANAMQLTKNMMDAAVASIGEAFLPVLNQLLQDIAPVIDKITVWAQANPELIRTIALVSGALIGSILSIKLFVDAFLGAQAMIGGLKAAFTLLLPAVKTAFAFLTGSVGLPVLAIAALIAAGVLLWQNWDLVKEKASELNEWIKSKFGLLPEPLQQAGRDIAEIFKFIWNTGKEYLTLMSELYAGTFESFATIATGAFQIVWTVIKTAFSGILNTISTTLQIIAALFSGGFALIKNTVSTVLAVIKAVISGDFKAIPSIIGNGLKSAAGIVGNMMTNILNIIKTAGSKLFSIGKDFIQGFTNGIKSIGSGAASAASTIVGNAIAAVRRRQDSASPSKVTDKLGKDFGKGYEKGIRSRRKAVKSEAQKLAEGAIKATQDGIQALERELRLFGNTSPLAALDDDIKQGKLSGDTGRLRNLTSELESKKQVAEINREIAGYGKIIYDNSMLNSNELTKISYELDNANGKYFSINEEAKKLLRTNAAMADEQKLLASATQVLLSGTRELALLETDGSAYSQLAYDLYDASNAMYDLSDAVKTQMLIQAGAIEQAKKSKAANDSITTSLNSIHKELSLRGDNSALAELMYDLNQTDKYAGAAADQFQKLVDAVTKLDNLKRGDALTSVMDELAQESPLDKIEADYQRRLEAINDYESQWTDLLGVHSAERTAIEQSYMDAKQQLMLGQSEAMFGALAGMAKGFLGEQSVVYRGLYALEKAYTLSSALLGSKKAIMDAWANTPGGFFAKSFAVGKVVLSTSAITSAIAGLSPKGFKQGGYTGNMGVNQVAGQVHGQEYVFDAQSTKNIGVDNLNAMRSGKAVGGGGDVNINVVVDAKGNAQVSGDNEKMGRDMANGIKAAVLDVIRKEKRQGGLLYD
ncbi:phage tail tape measure protein [Psychrobacter sp. BF1]|uniref:phage tail tape measure protein n=1 Tax=Psychrobacter sp. BF1 TaxID=2821147 RepID=UPI001C4E2307|nr:phage tail tape measure protein [Psychrobacter sp. BF1]